MDISRNAKTENTLHTLDCIHNCCVFWPAFGCCAHPKAGSTNFFSRFQPFSFFFNLFQWKINQNKTILSTPSGYRLAFACQPALRSSFSEDFCWNHWKKFNKNKKGWKWLKKSSSTSFWVRAAPKSWLKYTISSRTLTHNLPNQVGSNWWIRPLVYLARTNLVWLLTST